MPINYIKFVKLLSLLILGAALGACATLKQFMPWEKQEQKYEEKTVEALAQDSDDPALVKTLDELDVEFKTTLQQLQKKHQLPVEQVQNLEEGRDLIKRFAEKKTSAIHAKYEEYKIDFQDINRWKLSSEGKQQLSTVNWKNVCSNKRIILVYGYGGPLGSEEETKKISAGRAREIANWIVLNSPCKAEQIVDRGLGVDIKAKTITETKKLPTRKKAQLYAPNRYARVLVPK